MSEADAGVEASAGEQEQTQMEASAKASSPKQESSEEEGKIVRETSKKEEKGFTGRTNSEDVVVGRGVPECDTE